MAALALTLTPTLPLQNPLVFGWLLELATLDRAGVTLGEAVVLLRRHNLSASSTNMVRTLLEQFAWGDN